MHQPTCVPVKPISSRTTFISGAMPNQEKKQTKKAIHDMWNARICGERKSNNAIRVALLKTPPGTGSFLRSPRSKNVPVPFSEVGFSIEPIRVALPDDSIGGVPQETMKLERCFQASAEGPFTSVDHEQTQAICRNDISRFFFGKPKRIAVSAKNR